MNAKKVFVLMLLITTPGLLVFGQKQVEERNQTWFAYFIQARFTERSGLWVDLHYRTNDFIKESATSISRIGYTYFLSDQVRLTAGYGFIRHFSHVPETPDISEHRPWQQIQWIEKKKWFSMSQYFRIEQRFRPTIVSGEPERDYDNFNWRFRYNFALTFPLKGSSVEAKEPFLFLNDELHINAGKRISTNYFDQNRAFAGLGYQFTSQLNAQLGYLYVFQQQSAPNQFVHINAIRLFVFHNLDFRNKE
jgi:hypothetical protein